MTKQILTSLTFLLLSSSAVVAQTNTPPTAAQMAAHRVARLTALLTLNTAQQTQATTIFTNEESLITPLRTNLQTQQTALKTAVQQNDVNGIATDSAQIGSLTTQLTEDQAKADAAFYQILTPEQQTKYTQGQANGRGFGGRGGPGAAYRGRQ